MRLLFLDQFSEWGGAQICLRDVLSQACRRGWKAEVLAPGGGPLLGFARESGFGAHRLPLARYRNGSKSPRDLFRFGLDIPRAAYVLRHAVRRTNAQLIYVNGPRLLPAVWGTGVPVVFHSHNILDKRYVLAIAGQCLRHTQATVVAASQFVARPLAAILGHDSVHVIYNGVPDLRIPRSSRKRKLRIGIIGRIAPEKGHLEFLRAAAILLGWRPDLQFAVIGAALFSDPEYERTVLALGEKTGVEFCGWTDDVSQVFAEIDILAVPSDDREATPRVIMEAMSAGTAVVAYPSGGIPELIESGKTGLLTDSPSPEALARAIRLLIEDPGMRDRLCENARLAWETRFRAERFQRDVCDLIASFDTHPAAPVSRFSRDDRYSVPGQNKVSEDAFRCGELGIP